MQREQARALNTLIDSALMAPAPEHRAALLNYARLEQVEKLAERVRQRAARLCKSRRGRRADILATRDAWMLALYASATPRGWACAWCDGSSVRIDDQRRAGIGGIVVDSEGVTLERFSRALGEASAMDAEIAALAAVIRSAIEHGQLRLSVYCDSHGLVQLWNEHREDARLADLRRLRAGLERFALRAIPRLHNQPADALARKAV